MSEQATSSLGRACAKCERCCPAGLQGSKAPTRSERRKAYNLHWPRALSAAEFCHAIPSGYIHVFSPKIQNCSRNPKIQKAKGAAGTPKSALWPFFLQGASPDDAGWAAFLAQTLSMQCRCPTNRHTFSTIVVSFSRPSNPKFKARKCLLNTFKTM